MRRIEISALLSAGSAAEQAGRLHEAKARAMALIRALRDARAERATRCDGVRAVDAAAINWAMNIIHTCAGTTPH